MKNSIFWVAAILILFAASASAQSVVQVELAVPFGTATGKLITSPEHLIFVDEQQPEYSFVVHPQDIQDMFADGGVLTMQLKRAVRDRSGNSVRLSFKVPDKPSSDGLISWWKVQSASQGTHAAAAAAPVSVSPQPAPAPAPAAPPAPAPAPAP